MAERLRQLLLAKPFHPFTVRLRDGRSYSINRIAQAGLARSYQILQIADVDDQPYIGVWVSDIVEATENEVSQAS